MRTIFVFYLNMCVMLGCGSHSENPVPDAHSLDGNTADSNTSSCSAPLVRLQTSRDPECGGGNEHLWPIGMASSDCHGWRALDTSGNQHDNSANNIRCNPDGTFSYTQFAGNIDCVGSGVTKTFSLNTCQQDNPPTLYTIALDLNCCIDPEGSECENAVPSITAPGGVTFLNGTHCEE